MAAAPGAIFITTAPPHAAARLFKLFSAEAAVFIGIETFEHPRHAGLAPALLHRRQLICAEHAIAIGIGARQHAVNIARCAERGGSDQLITAEIAIAIGIGIGKHRGGACLHFFQGDRAIAVLIHLREIHRAALGLVGRGGQRKCQRDEKRQSACLEREHVQISCVHRVYEAFTWMRHISVAVFFAPRVTRALDLAGRAPHLRGMQDTDTDPALRPEFLPGPPERPALPAIAKGMRGRCPSCGEGALFTGYLKLAPRCAHCDEDLSHARADDGPAYLSILLTAKVMGTLQLFTYDLFRPEPWVMAVSFSLGVVAMALFLLPRFKGLIVGVQWAKRMHGF